MGREIGIYGKLPAQPDFARWNAGAFSAAGLDRWLEEAVGGLVQQRVSLSTAPWRFILVVPGARDAFVGVMVGSADAVGRSFPLALFERVDAADVVGGFPSLAFAAEAFWAGGTRVLDDAPRVQLPELIAACEALPPIASSAGAELVTSLPLAGHVSANPYAFRTLATACQTVGRVARAVRTPLTLDIEAATPESRLFWLELVRRTLRWTDGAPSFLWADGRLLVALGPPPPSLLLDAAVPHRNSPKVWPTRTQVDVAVAEARAALSAKQRDLLENPRSSLGDLLVAFGGAA